MNEAMQAWRVGQLVRAEALLTSYVPAEGKPDLRGFEWHYLWRLCHQKPAVEVLVRTGTPIQHELALWPDGSRVVTADRGGVSIHGLSPAGKSGGFRPPDDEPSGLIGAHTLSPDGSRLFRAYSHQGGVMQAVWDLRPDPPVRLWREKSPSSRVLAFSPGNRWLALYEQKLQVVDAATGKERWSTAVAGQPLAGCFTPDDRKLVVLALVREMPAEVTVWDVETGQRIHEWQSGPSLLGKIVCDSSGKRVAVPTASKIVIHDLASGRVQVTIPA